MGKVDNTLMIAFKKYSQNPNNTTSMVNYPWISENIEDDQVIQYQVDEWTVMSNEEFEAYKLANSFEYNNYNTARDNSMLKVRDYLHSNFRNLNASKIDFTLHLQNNIVLIKKIFMDKRGRPQVAKYFYPDLNNQIAEIVYQFTDNAAGFMIERKELLGYYRKDGTCPTHYIIHKRTYDFSSLTEAAESLQERVQARGNMIQEIKIVCLNLMTQYRLAAGDSVAQANMNSIVMGQGFFDTFKNAIDTFIEIAGNDFKTAITNDTIYPWLDADITPGVSLRAYIIDRLTY